MTARDEAVDGERAFEAATEKAARQRRRICLIACSANKLSHAAPAQDIYTGDVFRKSLAWARLELFDWIGVLSARHHLVDLEALLQPGAESMHAMSVDERRRWAAAVFAAIDERWQLRRDDVEVVLLAGAHYAEELTLRVHVHAPHTRIVRPLAGLGIGQQKAWLRAAIAALEAHERAGVSGSSAA